MIIVQHCNSDVHQFRAGCVFAWGVFALFGQDILQDTHIWLTWCIFRWHVSFQDILKCKRAFATKRSSKSRRASNDNYRWSGSPGWTYQRRRKSKKCQTVAKECQICSNTKSLWSGKSSHLKRKARKTTFWCRFSSSLHLRAKRQRAQHIVCNIQTTFLNPAHRLFSSQLDMSPGSRWMFHRRRSSWSRNGRNTSPATSWFLAGLITRRNISTFFDRHSRWLWILQTNFYFSNLYLNRWYSNISRKKTKVVWRSQRLFPHQQTVDKLVLAAGMLR